MTETWQRRLLYVAGAWNVLGGASPVLDPATHFAQFYTTSLDLGDPVQVFFFRCTWINVIAWGVGYILAAREPGARRPILLAGGAGKVIYSMACLALFSSGIGKPMLLTSAVIDLAFAGSFAYLVWRAGGVRIRARDS